MVYRELRFGVETWMRPSVSSGGWVLGVAACRPEFHPFGERISGSRAPWPSSGPCWDCSVMGEFRSAMVKKLPRLSRVPKHRSGPALSRGCRLCVWAGQAFGVFLGLRERSSTYAQSHGGCLLSAGRIFFFECDPEQQSLRRALLQTQH
jgi:hypothetical protein